MYYSLHLLDHIKISFLNIEIYVIYIKHENKKFILKCVGKGLIWNIYTHRLYI